MGKTDESFGQMLRHRRKHRGFTQDSLAGQLGVADKTVGKWERDEVLPLHPTCSRSKGSG